MPSSLPIHPRTLVAAFLVLLLMGAAAPVGAQPADASAKPPAVEQDFWWLFWFGAGWFGFVIMMLLALCSVAALALALEDFLRIRRQVIAPSNLADEVYAHLAQNELAKAEQVCKDRPSFLSTVLLAGLQEARHGYEAAEKAMEDAAQDQNARLHRKLEYLNILCGIGPMLGLLGTVWGMVVAFQQVAVTQGRADPGQLAGGIYQALYTTVWGLLIAIPGLGCYGILRNWADKFSAEASVLAERTFAPFKRGRATRKTAEPGPAPQRTGG